MDDGRDFALSFLDEKILRRRSPKQDQGGGNEDGSPFDSPPTPCEEEWKNLISMPGVYWDIPGE